MPGNEQPQRSKRSSISDVREAVVVLDVKVTRFNGQIAELTKECKGISLAMAKLHCNVHAEIIGQLKEDMEKLNEAGIRKVGFQRDLFRSLLAAAVGALAAYVLFIVTI